MNKVLIVLAALLAVGVGILFACASFFVGIFILLNPDGDGGASVGDWVLILLPAFMSVLSFVGVGVLMRHTVK